MSSLAELVLNETGIWEYLYLFSKWNFLYARGKSSPTLEQLTRFHERMPVLIFERVKTGQYLRFFNRYRRRLLFMGNMNVLGVLLLGLTGYWYIMHTRYDSMVHNALMSLLSMANLDNEPYHVVDWFQRKGRLIILVTKEFAQYPSQ